MKRIAMVLVIAGVFAITSRGQTFQNLDFESAYNLPGNPGNGVLVPVANALPNWTAYDGPPSNNDPYSSITYATSFNGGYTTVTLGGGSLAMNGEFSIWLIDAGSISQTGLVPNNAGSLQFEALGETDPAAFSVTLGVQNLSYSEISTGSGYSVFSATIPASLEGQTEALTFGILGPGSVTLDNIEFMPAPEPSEYALLGLGTTALLMFRRRR